VNVNLHIERLVLAGIDVDHAQWPFLQAAMEAELGRLIAEGRVGLVVGGGAMPLVRAGGFEMDVEGGAGRLGQQIACAVYEGIGK
jgi:hypothetical protein